MARSRSRRRWGMERLESRHLLAADPLPVLLVVADQHDFYYQEYGDTRAALEADGVEVRVAATTTQPTYPHAGTGEGGTSGEVLPDLPLSAVDPADYSAIVFIGGWGSSMYQYDFPGDYANDAYDGDRATKQVVNDLIGDFIAEDKYVAAICHGVTVLAWARVDGVSPLQGRTVSVPWIGSPAGVYQGDWYNYFELMQYPQVVANGAIANTSSGAYGDPSTAADDVVVDGRIITAENYDSAWMFGATIAEQVRQASEGPTEAPDVPDVPSEPDPPAEPELEQPTLPETPVEPLALPTLPVLLVIADQHDFYYQEYGDTRTALEASGVEVRVAATTTNPSYPHAGTGEGAGSGEVRPDIALSAVDPADYSAIVFVGGWGSSMYQYDFPGDYSNNAYDGDLATKRVVNDLIGEFIAEDKYIAAICHGVTVLAWARVDGVSPLQGRTVSVPWVGSPAGLYQGVWYNYFELKQYPQVVANGATANTSSGAYGDPTTTADDVVVDGRIITAEDYNSAWQFGLTIAQQVLGEPSTNPEPPAAGGDDAGSAPAHMSGDDLIVEGTSGDDVIYVWSDAVGDVLVWVNGWQSASFTLGASGRVVVHAGDGDDQVYATDLYLPATLYGGAGHDVLNGGHADDVIDGGAGGDCLWGHFGNDLLIGGDGADWLEGREGNDVLVGGDGDDHLCGGDGADVLIGGAGHDQLLGGAGEDLLIGGATSHDSQVEALLAILDEWSRVVPIEERAANLATYIAGDLRLRWDETLLSDALNDCLDGGDDRDALLV